MQYSPWEWSAVIAGAVIMIVYHVIFRQTFIGGYSRNLGPVWAFLHERNSKQSILAIQLCRDIMALATMMAAVMLSLALLAAKLSSIEKDEELLVVALLCAGAFLNYAYCANVVYYIVHNIILYPDDLIKSVHPAIVADNKERTRRLLRLCNRHFAFGRRLTYVSIPSCFIVAHPFAFFGAVVVSVAVWYRVDRYGVVLGGTHIDRALHDVAAPASPVDTLHLPSSAAPLPPAAAAPASVPPPREEREGEDTRQASLAASPLPMGSTVPCNDRAST